MNKVFEVIEARNIFKIDYSKITILTHPKSYIHAIVKFENALNKILVHDPDMKIPIHNSLYTSEMKKYKSQILNLNILNNLNLKKVDSVKFPLVKILNNYNLEAFIQKNDSNEKLKYRVRYGSFLSKEDASMTAKDIKNELGYECWVDKIEL